MDLLKFCCRFCDFDFVHSNFKVIQYLRLIIAFKLVLFHSSQILLLLKGKLDTIGANVCLQKSFDMKF